MGSTPDHVSASGPSNGAPPEIRELLAHTQNPLLARYRLRYPAAQPARSRLFELAAMLLLPVSGGAGRALRARLLRPFFGAFGRNVVIGRNCVFRHPENIYIGDDVVIDANCVIDARGAGEHGVRLADGVLLSTGVQIKCEGGPIHIGGNVNIGDNTIIVSQAGVWVGDGAAIAGACRIMGGAIDMSDFTATAALRSSAGPIRIGAGAWLAAGALLLDGASVGEHAIVSAGSVLTGAAPARTLVQGNPARPVPCVKTS